MHFWIVFGYGLDDFNQNRIRIGYGYHFSKTGLDRIVKIHYPIISGCHSYGFGDFVGRRYHYGKTRHFVWIRRDFCVENFYRFVSTFAIHHGRVWSRIYYYY